MSLKFTTIAVATSLAFSASAMAAGYDSIDCIVGGQIAQCSSAPG